MLVFGSLQFPINMSIPRAKQKYFMSYNAKFIKIHNKHKQTHLTRTWHKWMRILKCVKWLKTLDKFTCS